MRGDALQVVLRDILVLDVSPLSGGRHRLAATRQVNQDYVQTGTAHLAHQERPKAALALPLPARQ